MGLNSRIKQWLSDAEGAGLTGANGAPDVGLVGVTDGSGNILKVTDTVRRVEDGRQLGELK